MTLFEKIEKEIEREAERRNIYFTMMLYCNITHRFEGN